MERSATTSSRMGFSVTSTTEICFLAQISCYSREIQPLFVISIVLVSGRCLYVCGTFFWLAGHLLSTMILGKYFNAGDRVIESRTRLATLVPCQLSVVVVIPCRVGKSQGADDVAVQAVARKGPHPGHAGHVRPPGNSVVLCDGPLVSGCEIYR